MGRRSARRAAPIFDSSSIIRSTARERESRSNLCERGLRSSVGERPRDAGTRPMFKSASRATAPASRPPPKFSRAISSAPQTLSRRKDTTLAQGQSWRKRARTRAAKAVCCNRTLPARMNRTGSPRPANLRAQWTPSLARDSTAVCKISLAMRSPLAAALNTGTARAATSFLAADMAQSIKSSGSFSNKACRRLCPSPDQWPSRSRRWTVSLRARRPIS